MIYEGIPRASAADENLNTNINTNTNANTLNQAADDKAVMIYEGMPCQLLQMKIQIKNTQKNT